ncbi:glycoside hydrolase [Sedimentisphaera cyanobacteriorum]|uniref:glycoside hydrolase n=1 Tax=Sedimentisphaera cyanobacteriorum TaxID=1940790 RepID=UPI0013734499|nr:glycoside hydrolase [Sedimentisphaera cyanobacteriorum]
MEVRPGSRNLITKTDKSVKISIDTSKKHQKITSFGASDCWTAQMVGQWPKEKTDAIADMLFSASLKEDGSPKGIGLSSWRFNIGAGSDINDKITDPWRQSSWLFNEAKDDIYMPEFEKETRPRIKGQRTFLRAARERGVEEFTAFTISPPINMTKNGRGFCSKDVGSTNLQEGKTGEFCDYIIDSVRALQSADDVEFDFISPINEPEWDWNKRSQEGCRYNNSQMSEIAKTLHGKIENQESVNARLLMPESGHLKSFYDWQDSSDKSKGKYIEQFFEKSSDNYSGKALSNLLCGHSYFLDDPSEGLVDARVKFRKALDKYPELDYRHTEYCILGKTDHGFGGNGRDLSITSALFIARVIHYDLTIVEACGWDWWLGISPHDYKDGLVYTTKTIKDGRYNDSKMLWAMGNFSRFIRPGMYRAELERSDGVQNENAFEGLMASAYAGNNEKIAAAVFVNYSGKSESVSFEKDGLPEDARVVPYITDSASDLAPCKAGSLDNSFKIPAKSIVTFVIQAK